MTLSFSSFCGREPHEDMRVADILIMRARHSGLGACLSDNVKSLHCTLYSTLLFFPFNTIGYVVCKLLQIRGHRFDSGTRLHLC